MTAAEVKDSISKKNKISRGNSEAGWAVHITSKPPKRRVQP
jgi:hypothetical protein